MILKIKQFGKEINNFLKNFLFILIRMYKYFISPFFPGSCRYYPSCSDYCVEALKTFGILKGLYLSILRILKCNPIFRPKIDPVCKHKNKTNKV